MSDEKQTDSIDFIDSADNQSLLDLAAKDEFSRKESTSDDGVEGEPLDTDSDDKNKTPLKTKFKPDWLNRKRAIWSGCGVFVVGIVSWAIISGFSFQNLMNDGTVSFFSFDDKGPSTQEVFTIKMSEYDRKNQEITSKLGELSRDYLNVGDEYSEKVKGVEQSLSSQIIELRNIVQGYESAFNLINQEFENLRTEMSTQQRTMALPASYENVLKQQVEFKKNQGWYSNRLKALEAADKKIFEQLSDIELITSALPSIEQVSKRVTVDVTSPWVLKGASDKVAVLFNENTKKSMRVTIGMDVPYCGPVLTIEPKTKTVVTQSCRVRK